MEGANHSDTEFDDEFSRAPLSPVGVLRREKSRLEESLTEIEKAINELEVQPIQKMRKMEDGSHHLRSLSESSSRPFLGFTPKSFQPVRSYQPGVRALNALEALQESIDAQSSENRSVKLAPSKGETSKDDVTNFSEMDSTGANTMFSREHGRENMKRTNKQQVNKAKGSSVGLSVQTNTSRGNALQTRQASAIYHDSDAWSNEGQYGDMSELENLIESSQFDRGIDTEGRDQRVLPDFNFVDEQNERSTKLSQSSELNRRVVEDKESIHGSFGHRDQLGSTEVELLNVHANRADDNYQWKVDNYLDNQDQIGSTRVALQKVYLSRVDDNNRKMFDSYMDYRDRVGSTKVELQNTHPNNTNENPQRRSVHFDPHQQTHHQHRLQSGYQPTYNESFHQQRPPEPPHFNPTDSFTNPNFGKIRIIFVAAAKSHGTSLNDNLVTGPDFLKLLPGVLFRFRQGPIGFIGDIKEMFHRVLIQEPDVKCQRILWRGREISVEAEEYEMTVMMFGATCSPSSAIYIKNRKAQRFENQYPEAVNAILHKHYMDDYLDSKFSVDEAIKIIKEVIFIHQQGSFEIRNWVSSSKEVMEAIPEHLRGKSNSAVSLDHENIPGRVLGVLWIPEEDVFTFSGDFAKDLLAGKRLPTKREVLRIVNSIYDPLGFVTHFVITGRMIVKNIWKSKIGWDDTIPEDINQDWKLFLRGSKNIGNVQIDRCYSPNLQHRDNLQLHIFGDSSNDAYCGVAFMRIQIGDLIQVKFITAKARVTPLKEVTDDNIHRSELQAALLVSKLSKFVLAEHELQFDDCFFWTDSMAVWYWIQSETKRYKQFVANRLNEIWALTRTESWNWLPSHMNVADDATRFGSVEFSQSNRWYTGPEFLYDDISKWPKPKSNWVHQDKQDWMEIVNVGHVAQVVEFALPQVDRFSNWRRLIGATAWMLRYLNNCNPNKPNISSESLGIDEWTNAEMKWILHSQQRSFAQEISDLHQNDVVNSRSRIFNLSPEIDEHGILRLYGRADKLPDSVIGQRRPIILDGQDGSVRLLIRFYHEKYNHIGHETVLNEMKQRFWILKATITLKKIRSECWKCKLMKAKPQPTIMGQLPVARIDGGNPSFHYTGMDYFGPILVMVGRQLNKRYGVLFTCLTVRAVHIEIAASETTDSCIMAIRRFISRRGCPKEIFSDNGSNLRGSDNELRAVLQALDQDKIRAALTTHRIKWNFNPPTASHMGGSWERLVGSIKTAFYATLKSVHPTEETLATLLTEAEHVVNSRPLLELSNDPNEPETLTPNHFLIGRSSASAPIGVFDKSDLILKKQWRAAQHLADLFWQRWMKEYRPTLTKRTKWFRKARNPRIGELVYIVDDQQSRGHWPRGIITNVFPGDDGHVRVVDVRTNKNTYRRPITKICLFDLNESDD